MTMHEHPEIFDRDHAVDYTSYQDGGPERPLTGAERRFLWLAWGGMFSIAGAFIGGFWWLVLHV